MVFSAGVPGLWQMVTFSVVAAANRAGTSELSAVATNSFSARRRLIEPSAIPLASSSKERSLASGNIGCLPSPKGGTRGNPAALYNEDKYEGLQGLAHHSNAVFFETFLTNFRELLFPDVRT